jgi:hypothetical protein
MLKELLYHTILYDYSGNEQEDDNVINLDTATVDEIESKLGGLNE